MSFIEPSPLVYGYFFLQTFVFVPLVILLALMRFGAAQGPSRWVALGAVALGLGAVFVQFGPAILAIHEGWLPIFAGRASAFAMGLALPLVPSCALALSAFVPGRRWRGLDWLHAAALLVLLGLFVWVRLL